MHLCDCCLCDTFLHLQMYNLPQVGKNLSRIAYLLKTLGKNDCVMPDQQHQLCLP